MAKPPRKRRSGATKRRLKAIAFWAFPLLFLGGIMALPALHLAKQFWSKKWLNESRQLHEEKSHVLAFQKALSAYYWNGNDEEVVLNLARKASHVNHPGAYEWWVTSIDNAELTPEDLVLFLKTCIRAKRSDVAIAYMGKYQALMPATMESWQIQIELMRTQLKHINAFYFVEHLLGAGEDDWYLHRSKVELLMELGFSFRPEAIKHLLTVAESKEENGVKAITMLFKEFSKDLDEDSRKRLVALASAHPDAKREALLLNIADQLKTKSITWDVFKEKLSSEFDLALSADLAQVCDWFAPLAMHEEIYQILSKKVVSQNRELFIHLINAMLRLDRPEEAYAMTQAEGDLNPLNPMENLLARARTSKAMKDEEAYENNLSLAMDVADPKELAVLEYHLYSLGEFELLESLYLEYLNKKVTAFMGKNKLLQLYYQTGNETGLKNILFKLDFDDFEGIPSQQIFFSYLHLIYNNDINAARQALESVSARHPGFMDFRVMLSFAYVRSGQAQLGLTLLGDGADALYPRMKNRYFKLAYAFVMAANNNTEYALKARQEFRDGILMPKEKRLLQLVTPQTQPAL